MYPVTYGGMSDIAVVNTDKSRRTLSHRLGINLEDSLVGILQLPYQHHTNHNRITCLVIHLDRFGIEVAHTKRKLLLTDKRIQPIITGCCKSATIFTEEKQYASLTRLHQDETASADDIVILYINR